MGIRKINPMVRAIATMGAVAALVGGITYAQINTTAPVSLTNNTLAAATASLAIAGDNTCAPASLTTAVQGMSFTNLRPDVASAQFPFCLENTGNVPLNLTANIPTSLTGFTLNPNDVNLHFTCGVSGQTTGAITQDATVGALNSGQVAFGSGALDNTPNTDDILACNVTAEITAPTETSGASIPAFTINFSGSTTDSSTPPLLNN